jgi:hypothetical protein
VEKQLQKILSKTPCKPARIPKPLAYGRSGLFLLSYLTSIQEKQKTTVRKAKAVCYKRASDRITTLEDSSNLEEIVSS